MQREEGLRKQFPIIAIGSKLQNKGYCLARAMLAQFFVIKLSTQTLLVDFDREGLLTMMVDSVDLVVWMFLAAAKGVAEQGAA
jgi:hypothetical protein